MTDFTVSLCDESTMFMERTATVTFAAVPLLFRKASADIVNTAIYKENLLWGISQFNNFPEAFLSIFQSITLEGWVRVLYTVSHWG